MLQLELYVANIDRTAKLFSSVFDLEVITEKPGYKQLRHFTNFDIMLFNPSENYEGENHWTVPEKGMGGHGIEIVIVTKLISNKLKAVRELGYKCSDLRHTPWGSIEFTFQLVEGYLLRIKEIKVV